MRSTSCDAALRASLPKSTRFPSPGKTSHRPDQSTCFLTHTRNNSIAHIRRSPLYTNETTLTLPHDDQLRDILPSMAALRSQSAVRLLRATSAPATRFASAALSRRLQSSVTSATAAVPATETNQPDYDIQADKATSYAEIKRLMLFLADC
jgi:hypothetical protein